jgi:Na+/melibiose symporter-like transporter
MGRRRPWLLYGIAIADMTFLVFLYCLYSCYIADLVLLILHLSLVVSHRPSLSSASIPFGLSFAALWWPPPLPDSLKPW